MARSWPIQRSRTRRTLQRIQCSDHRAQRCQGTSARTRIASVVDPGDRLSFVAADLPGPAAALRRIELSRALADLCERTTIGGGTLSIHMLGMRPRIPAIVPTAGSMTFYPNRGFCSKDYETFKGRERVLSVSLSHTTRRMGPYLHCMSETLRIDAFKQTDSFSIDWIIPNGDGSGRRVWVNEGLHHATHYSFRTRIVHHKCYC